jgi:hypothetical protein
MAMPAADKEIAVHNQPVPYIESGKSDGEQDVALGTPVVDIARIERVYRYGDLNTLKARSFL